MLMISMKVCQSFIQKIIVVLLIVKLDNESPPDYSEDDLKFIDFEGEQNGN